MQVQAVRQLDGRAIFSPAVVIVPDERVATWLKHEVAEEVGVVANYKFYELEELARELAGDDLLDKRMLRAYLQVLLADDELLERAELLPVRRYLGDLTHNRQDRDARERRRFQLADQLAGIYDGYMRVRPGLLDAWEREQRWFQETTSQSTEVWQMILWRALRARFPDTKTLRQAASLLEQRPPRHRVVHYFGFGCVDPVVYELLGALSKQAVVFAYALDPSREYWQEMRFGRPEEEQMFSSAGVMGGSLDYAGDDTFWSDDAPDLLRAWGFARAMHLRNSQHIEAPVYHPLFDDPPEEKPKTLLGAIQRDLLLFERAGARAHDVDIADHSVEVIAAPSIRREIEVVASQIWELVDRSHADPDAPPLALDKIGVLVPESQREVYLTHIRSVFPATRRLPYNMVDMPALSWSRSIEAVQMLLALPFGQFRRQELLRLLTHPNVAGRFAHVDVEDWMRWCDDLRILHGADHSDHADTYISGELFHWDQGMKRLALGGLMTGKMAQDRRAFELDGAYYLPYEYPQGQLPSAAQLVVLARSLIEDARFCRQARMPLAKWADYCTRMVATYLVQREPEDEMLLHTCRQLMAGMARYDVTGEPISYRLAYETAIDMLDELEVGRGQFMLDGVVVMGLEADRTIPFDVTFVVGMSEGHYPDSEPRRPEDLRFATDKDGALVNEQSSIPDISLRERGKNTVLEALLDTRERFFMSYVCRDPHTGDERQPSALVGELIYSVEQDYAPTVLGEDDDERLARVERALITRHEAKRFHPRYFPDVYAHSERADGAQELTPSAQPEALEEARVSALRQNLEVHCATHEAVYPTRPVLQSSSEPVLWDRLKGRLGLADVPTHSSVTHEPVLRLSTYDLRSFLECPLQGSARFLLRLDDDDDEILLKESEVFEPSGAARAALLRTVFLDKLSRENAESRPLDFGPIYDDQARYFELEGLVPTGPFLRAARQRHLALLELWQENLPLFGAGRSPKMEVRRFGRPGEHDQVDVPQAPLSIDVNLAQLDQRIRVEIFGKTEAIMPEWPATLITHSAENARYISPKFFMRGFLDQVLLAASGDYTSDPWSVIINPGEEALRYKQKNCVRKFKPMDQRTARGYLRDVIEDMLTQVHAYYMPIEVVFEHMQGEEPIAQIAERKRRNRWQSTSSDYGPIKNPERFEPPESAEKIIARRYGLYFEQVGQGRRT